MKRFWFGIGDLREREDPIRVMFSVDAPSAEEAVSKVREFDDQQAADGFIVDSFTEHDTGSCGAERLFDHFQIKGYFDQVTEEDIYRVDSL